jgi:hypothetical protein
MRALLIVERHIEGMLGLFVGRQHSARPFLCVGDGENKLHSYFFPSDTSQFLCPSRYLSQ